ncbi:MAG: aryl-sulfate sulfotransferase [Dehalococcoidia bacterium]
MGWSANRTMGLTCHQPAQSFKGYTLLSPLQGDSAYLLDMDGLIVRRWRFPDFRVLQSRLLPTGNLLVLCTEASLPPPPQTPFDQPPPLFGQQVRRLGGNATHLRELDWDGSLVWEYRNEAIHHDFVRLESGNTIVVEWVELPPDLAREVRGGARRPREKFPPLLSDDIVELDCEGKEVNRIHLWKLLDPVRDPICPLEQRWEWTHLNSLGCFLNGDLVFSCRQNSRVGIIEKQTGGLRWKFGAPRVYHQHHATPLPNGNVQIFDNGMHRVGLPYSQVVEVDPSDDTSVWEYRGEPPEQFFSGHISGAERQPNGNVLVCEGSSGRVFEVTRRGETVWEWVTPFMNLIGGSLRPWIFRAYRYAPDFSGLAGHDLDPARYAELNRLHGL